MNNAIYKILARLAADERGLTAVEYAVLGAMVVAAIALVAQSFGTNLDAAFKALF